MELIAYVNGEFLPLDRATIHIEDRGFQFADGVYEVIACFGGNYLDLQPHLERLKHSCHEIDIDLPHSLTELEALVHRLYDKNSLRDAMVYIQVTRGIAPRSHVICDEVAPSLIMTLRELPKPSEEKLAHGTSAITLRDFRWGRCDIKSIALLASIMGKQQAVARGVDEAFWYNDEHHMLEGTATNLFAMINGVLVTHPLDHQVLGGIMRDMVLRHAAAAGINVEERPWLLNEANLSECMMSSTTNAVLPVCRINNMPVADGKPGPVGALLRSLIIDELEQLRNG
jgi:D-alanine transaminase